MTILRLKCTKFDFGWGSAPDPAGGAYSAPQTPLVGFGGRFVAGEGLGWGRGRKGEGRDGEVEGREGRAPKLLLNQGPSGPCYATGSILRKSTRTYRTRIVQSLLTENELLTLH